MSAPSIAAAPVLRADITPEAREWLQTMPSAVLLAIARGEVDAAKLAGETMAGRGVDRAGLRVSFAAAAASWGRL